MKEQELRDEVVAAARAWNRPHDTLTEMIAAEERLDVAVVALEKHLAGNREQTGTVEPGTSR